MYTYYVIFLNSFLIPYGNGLNNVMFIVYKQRDWMQAYNTISQFSPQNVYT